MIRGILCAALLAAVCFAQDQKRPNVVLLISDDQHWSDFGFMGSDVVKTPHLDALAERSLVFPRGYVPTALCRASLATLVSGLYAHQHRITGNDPPKGTSRARMLMHIDRLETLPSLLGEVGYRSLQTGKWWEGHYSRGGFDEGMTHGDPGRGGRHGDQGLDIGRKTMDPVLDFIDDCAAKDTPFFVWYAPFLPHTPHNPPERILQNYRRSAVSPHVFRYQAMCEWFDESCGQLLGHLERRKLTDDTLVILVTDNGWIQRTDRRGYAPRSKRTTYEGGVRTPITLAWPGRITPERRDVPVSSVDIPATILAACGVEAPKQWPGVDLRDAREHAPVFGAAYTHDCVDIDDPASSLKTRWVLRDPHKLHVHVDGQTELFDVRADPAEERPLDDPGVERTLRADLDEWWPGKTRRPNLLFVVTDDQRFDQMGCAGHPVLTTPVIDSLASRGVRFTNAFVTTSICASTRATLMTGRSEGGHGYTFRKPPMGPGLAAETYFARLHEAGYRTGFVGKWGVRFAKGALGDALDYRKQPGQPYIQKGKPHLTARVADRAIEFLEQQTAREPFCLTVSFHAPHAQDNHDDQFIPDPAFANLYADAEVPVPPLAEFGFAALPPFLQESLGRVRWAWRFDNRQKQIRRTKDYWRMIHGVDHALGRVLAALDQRGFKDDTVIVFTSDNGYFLGERGLAGKWLIYEESIRVPLIIVDPRDETRRGVVAEQMVLSTDMAPTLLDYAGVPAPAGYEGKSVAPLVRGETPEWRTEFFYEHGFDHPKIPKSVGVRGERWVYARYYEQEPVFEQLFDLREDPGQVRDLAREEEFGERLGEMRQKCDRLRR